MIVAVLIVAGIYAVMATIWAIMEYRRGYDKALHDVATGRLQVEQKHGVRITTRRRS